jgi:hypothetical protein
MTIHAPKKTIQPHKRVEIQKPQAPVAKPAPKPVAKRFSNDEMSQGKAGMLARRAAQHLASHMPIAIGNVSAGTKVEHAHSHHAKKSNSMAVSAQAPHGVAALATKDATALAHIKEPSARAKELERFVQRNPDVGYQKALLEAAKPALEELTMQVVNKNSGFSAGSRQAALESLSRTTEMLGQNNQKLLAKTVASTMGNNTIGDDAGDFGSMLKQGVKNGAGASFGVRLASELESTKKSVTANDVSKFVSQGINDVRKDFESSSEKVGELHLRLAQETASWKLSATDQGIAFKEFDKNNHLTDATKTLESQGKLLASTLSGAAIASRDPALQSGGRIINQGGFQIRPNADQAELISAAKEALQKTPQLANTKEGASAISSAIIQSGKGEISFLDAARDVIKEGKDGAKGVLKLRSAVLQATGVTLLKAAAGNTFDSEKNALLAGLNKNAKLFGTNEANLKALTHTLSQFKPGMSETELKKLSGAAKGNISKLGESKSPLAQSFKGLALVFGTVGAVKDWKNFSDARVQKKIETIANTLSVAKEGADFATSTLSRFAGDAATGSEVARVAAVKLLGIGAGALGAVVSGWNAFGAFKDGKIREGAADTMVALGSALAVTGAALDAGIISAPAGLALNVIGGVLVGAGTLMGLFKSEKDPFEEQQNDLGKILEKLGVNHEVAERLKDLDSDGQTLGTWVNSVASKLNISSIDLVRSMNNWSPQQVTDFIDAARLQRDSDENNDNRRNNAGRVLGTENASALEDPSAFQMKTYVADRKKQEGLRQTVNQKTGVVTYNDALVQKAADWVKNSKLI